MLTFPTGLIEAAVEGHPDALQDLAHELIKIGDPRGADFLWVTRDGIKILKSEHWPDYLSKVACPRCGSVSYITPTADGVKCDDVLLRPNGEGGYTPIFQEKCLWEGQRSELLTPLWSKGT